MKISFSSIIREMFNDQNQLTLKEIFQELSKNPNIDLPVSILQHRIRSTLYSLKKSGEINHIKNSTYRMN